MIFNRNVFCFGMHCNILGDTDGASVITKYWNNVRSILVITPLLLYLYSLLILLCPYCPHILINVSHRIPLLFFLCRYIIIVRLARL